MKVAVIGGGGFRTPLVWESLRDAPSCLLTLYDLDRERLGRIAGVIAGLERERPGGPSVTFTTRIEEALDGADYVFSAIRVGGLEGRIIDETVPLRFGVLGQETVGPGGICFALRTVPVMIELAEEVARRAPTAWFLNFTNPAGLVTEVLQGVLGDRAVGICDAPGGLSARVAAALGRRAGDLEFDYAGLNHLGWVISVKDGERDLLPDLLADTDASSKILEVGLLGIERVRALGMIPNEYLVYLERPDDIVRSFEQAGQARAEVLLRQVEGFYAGRGDALQDWRAARDARFGTYMAETRPASDPPEPVESPSLEDDGPGEAGYAAIAASFVQATSSAGESALMLNVANRGRLPELDDQAVIETSCRVSRDGIRSLRGAPLPRPQSELVCRIKEVERATIRAAVSRSRRHARTALAMHPLVPSPEIAEHILDAYLAAFARTGAPLL